MYIEIHNADIKQESLYFKLNSIFSLESENGKSEKIKGIYAIYKDDICLYVGQSKNIASRVATHMRGKYESFTNIYIWNVEDIGFSDYMSRSNTSQKAILDNCEQYVMTILKPLENLLIDMDKEISKQMQPDICFETDSSFAIHNLENCIIITDSYSYVIDDIETSMDYLNYHEYISSDIHSLVRKSIMNKTVYGLHTKGINNEA